VITNQARRMGFLDSLPVSGPPMRIAKSALRSLPLIFGGPEVREFPYLRPERERALAWRAKIGASSAPGLKIEVAWAGRDDHPRADMRDCPVGVLAQALSGCG